MNNLPVFTVSLMLVLISISSCKEAPLVPNEIKSLSYGDWVIAQAVKQGKLTKMLDGTVFSIQEDNLSTNLFGSEKTFLYKRIGDELRLEGGDNPILTIDKSTADTLILGMKRKRKRYQLLMLKNSEKLQEAEG